MRRHLPWAGVALLTLVQFGFWMHQFGPHLAAFYDYAARILTGHPDWRAVQSRLLAPLILVRLMGWLPWPLPVFTALFLALANAIFYRVARGMLDARGALGALAVSIFLWLMLFCKISQGWDLIEMSVLPLFWGLMAQGRRAMPDVRLLILYGVQLLNRESALFIALAVMLAGGLTVVWRQDRARGWRSLGAGGAMLAVGVALIEILRKSLFISGPAARAGLDLKHRHFENFVIYKLNWMVTRQDLASASRHALIPVVWVGLMALFAAVARRGWRDRHAGVTGYGMAMLLYAAAIFITAEINETRVMQILVPVAVINLIWLFRAPLNAPAT